MGMACSISSAVVEPLTKLTVAVDDDDNNNVNKTKTDKCWHDDIDTHLLDDSTPEFSNNIKSVETQSLHDSNAVESPSFSKYPPSSSSIDFAKSVSSKRFLQEPIRSPSDAIADFVIFKDVQWFGCNSINSPPCVSGAKHSISPAAYEVFRTTNCKELLVFFGLLTRVYGCEFVIPLYHDFFKTSGRDGDAEEALNWFYTDLIPHRWFVPVFETSHTLYVLTKITTEHSFVRMSASKSCLVLQWYSGQDGRLHNNTLGLRRDRNGDISANGPFSIFFKDGQTDSWTELKINAQCKPAKTVAGLLFNLNLYALKRIESVRSITEICVIPALYTSF